MSTAPYVALATALDRIHARVTERRLARRLRAETAYVDRVVNTAILAGVVPPPEPQPDDEPTGGPEDCRECRGTGLVEHFEWSPAGRRWVAISCWSCRGTGEAGAA